MKLSYRHTTYSCFTAYVVQAITNCFMPLLFVTFQKEYEISFSQISLLITVNFLIQLSVDLISVFLADKIGYRVAAVLAHVLAATGFVLLAVLPDAFPDPFAGILTAISFSAVGGGLIEVIISPMVEACPSDNKAKAMSMLHSFYCWGCLGVILISTVFFSLFGTENWRIIAVVWAVLPAANAVMFTRVPIETLIAPDEKQLSLRELIKNPFFIIFIIVLLCAGASEQAVSQWASAFAEKGLGVSKTIGDIAGPALFAVLMGISRVIFGKFGERINLDRMMLMSAFLCVMSYLVISLSPSPVVSLAGVAVCGFSVGIMWPGGYSRASALIPGGGTAMFALLALAGDIGCCSGPAVTGLVADLLNDDIKAGILASVVFPAVLAVIMLFLIRRLRKQKS